MQADPYWACAGAVNVMLVFFFRFNAEQLRRLNIYYWIICYGIPAVPAIFGLIYRKNGEHMYGNATVSPRLTHPNQNSLGLHRAIPGSNVPYNPISHKVLTFSKSSHSPEKILLTSETQALVLVLKHLHHDPPLRLLHSDLDCRILRNLSLHPRRSEDS